MSLRPLENVEENVARLSGNKCFELSLLEYDATEKSSHCQCEFCEVLYSLLISFSRQVLLLMRMFDVVLEGEILQRNVSSSRVEAISPISVS